MSLVIKLVLKDHQLDFLYIESIFKCRTKFKTTKDIKKAKRYKNPRFYRDVLDMLDKDGVEYELIDIESDYVKAIPDRAL